MLLKKDLIWHDRKLSKERRSLNIKDVPDFYYLISDLELVKLPEDITLAGFTPLMLNPQDPCYVEKTEDMVIRLCYVFDNF